MQLLASPIIWIFLGVLYFMNKSKTPEATNLDVFDAPKVDASGSSTVITTSGQKIKDATINTAQAKSKAIQLVELFDAFFSSEADIVGVFNGLNYSDFILIYDQFGTSHVRSFFGNEGLGSSGTDDLIYWLRKEVTSTRNLNKLNKLFPTIF